MALSAKAQLSSDGSGDTHERFMNLVKESPRPKVLRDEREDSPYAKAAAAGPSKTSAAVPSHAVAKPTAQRSADSAQSTSNSKAAQPMHPPPPRARRTRAGVQSSTANDGTPAAAAGRARTGPGSVLYPKGTQVRKKFNAGWFNGKITCCWDMQGSDDESDERVQMRRVRYSDGDTEDIEIEETAQLVQAHQEWLASRSPTAAATKAATVKAAHTVPASAAAKKSSKKAAASSTSSSSSSSSSSNSSETGAVFDASSTVAAA
eukprot:5490-Heterococcus_DN1.PRE.1